MRKGKCCLTGNPYAARLALRALNDQEGIMAKISDVIEFEGSVDDLVWKSPIENFNTTSVLIVDETHQALVLVNGVQYGLYGPGRHVLETPNIPAGLSISRPPAGHRSPARYSMST